jgi:uncharacterized protein YdaU (DUF1376 family)
MSAPPYMPLYVADYLGDTTHLSCIEHGAYLLLMMALWRAGGRLDDDDPRLARHARLRLSEWRRLKPTVIGLFDRTDGQLSHGRVTLELEKYLAGCARNAVSGAKGGRAKALIHKQAALARAAVAPAQPEPEPKPDPPSGEGRARRAPSHWTPSADDFQVGEALGLDPDRIAQEAQAFRDHDFSRSHADWSALFRNWLRRTKKYEAADGCHRPDDKLARRAGNLARAVSGFARLVGDG